MTHSPAEPDAGTEQDLRRRLSEAEETLRAIRDGEVDALVVRGPNHDEVSALGGENSYRAFMQAMDIGAAAVDGSGKLIYANGALVDLLGAQAPDLQNADLATHLGPDGAAALRRLLEHSGPDRRSEQLSLESPSGERHVEVTAAPLELVFGRGYALTFTDVTERVEAAAASESERIGRAVMASSNDAVVVCDDKGVITHANAKVRQFCISGCVGKHFEVAFELSFPVSSGLIGAREVVELALSGSNVRAVEANLAGGDRARHVVVSASPLRSSGGTIGGCIVALADVTEQRATDRKQKLLMGELTHRVKNTLTLVLSIANRTAAGSNDLSDFRPAFARRLEALAATHNLLAEDFSGGLTLEDIAVAELAPYIAVGSERLTIEGMQYRLTSDTAVALGLVFHELVTNAVKYGALSNERGRVSLTAANDGEALAIEWREENGPPVQPPERHGFGQTLILRGLGQSGAQSTTLDYLPDGVVCRMYIPNSSVLTD
ncbi:HWE histidine kinase domain-containing protein [Sphingomonas sp.]|uniref:sensor histidine kinase n=1 Tax=Sphingomonas sp. TaxID=28214 RepID=UPI0025D4E832|nr:HWE histidine kinase domain-containing protein [Sphingomonas sp.]MBV9527576.1 PAS domain-containing protein [Sphingomonas sp.]